MIHNAIPLAVTMSRLPIARRLPHQYRGRNAEDRHSKFLRRAIPGWDNLLALSDADPGTEFVLDGLSWANPPEVHWLNFLRSALATQAGTKLETFPPSR